MEQSVDALVAKYWEAKSYIYKICPSVIENHIIK